MPDRYQLYAAPARAQDSSEAAARQQLRMPVFAIAVLAFADELARPVACTLHDLSQSGARLEIDRERLRSHEPPAELPEYLTLYFCPERTEVSCRLAWRDGRHFGVAFLEPPHASDRTIP